MISHFHPEPLLGEHHRGTGVSSTIEVEESQHVWPGETRVVEMKAEEAVSFTDR